MATIRFIAKKKADLVPIYLRLRHGRSVDITKDTGLRVQPVDWNYQKQQPKNTTAQGKVINLKLTKLKTSLLERFNIATDTGTIINANWLAEQIDIIQNRGTNEQQAKGDLLTYIDYYIEYIPRHIKKNGKRGLAETTVKSFKLLRNKLNEFQRFKKKNYRIIEVTPDLACELDLYMNQQGYSDSYAGILTKRLKTVCKHARKEGLAVASNLDDISSVRQEGHKIILSFDELKQIQETTFKQDYLNNARDWLLIGCYTGQRVSDLLNLTSNNIIIKSGLELIVLTQQKTGKTISLPVHHVVKSVLDERNGMFPRKISDVKFNTYIKEVCKLAGINKLTLGSKMNPETNRKEVGKYPKHELVTSHICRRSFATNHYGDVPTPILMSATGHATEKVFLTYIGKPATEQAQQLAEYWAKAEQMSKKETNLKVIKGAI